VLGVEIHWKQLLSIRWKISEAVRENDDSASPVSGVRSFPALTWFVWENEHFVYHRHSPLVLGVEMDWKSLISIGYRISEAIRENDDVSAVPGARSFPAFAHSWFVWKDQHFVYHRHSPFVFGVEIGLKPFISIRYRISEAIRENDDVSPVPGARSFPAFAHSWFVWINQHFIYHRHSPFVLGVEIHLKPFIIIGYRISEAIRENDDVSPVPGARSFPAFAHSWFVWKDQHFVYHRHSPFVLGVEIHLKPFIRIG
jgi:hypothetical protein